MTTMIVRRRPRRPAPVIPEGVLEVPAPPEIAQVTASRWGQLLSMLPLLTGAAATALLFAGREGGAYSYVVGGVFGISSLGMLATNFGSGSGQPKKAEMMATRREYLRHLAALRTRVRDVADRQRTGLHYRHPEPDLAVVHSGQPSTVGAPAHRCGLRRCPARPRPAGTRHRAGTPGEPPRRGAGTHHRRGAAPLPRHLRPGPRPAGGRLGARLLPALRARPARPDPRPGPRGARPARRLPRPRRTGHRGLRRPATPARLGLPQVAAARPASGQVRRARRAAAGRRLRRGVGAAARRPDRRPATVLSGRRARRSAARGGTRRGRPDRGPAPHRGQRAAGRRRDRPGRAAAPAAGPGHHLAHRRRGRRAARHVGRRADRGRDSGPAAAGGGAGAGPATRAAAAGPDRRPRGHPARR